MALRTFNQNSIDSNPQSVVSFIIDSSTSNEMNTVSLKKLENQKVTLEKDPIIRKIMELNSKLDERELIQQQVITN